MKRMLIALVACFFASQAHPAAMVCGEPSQVIGSIERDLGAWPLWVGQSPNGTFILFINRDKAWVLVAGGDDRLCIVSYGSTSDGGLGVQWMARPLPDDILKQTYDAFIECDSNQSKTAIFLKVSRETVQRRVRQAIERGLHLSPGGRDAMNLTRLNGAEVNGGWRHAYDAEGKKIETVRWSAPKVEYNIEDVIDKAKAAFSSIPKAPPIPSPRLTEANLLTLYPLFDVHMGARADSLETGGDDYNTKLAVSDINLAIGNVMALSPDSSHALLVVGGDFFHATDDTNQTQRSKNVLDVDTRLYVTMETGVEVIATTIDRLAAKHKWVTVRVLRGNHDETSHMTLSIGLTQRYRNHKRIKIESPRRDIFMHQWGKCLIAAHHGDKQKPERLAMVIAEICPFWSESPYRVVFTGHLHSQQSEEFPGILWERLRAFCPPDAFGSQFAPRRAMHAITFDRDRGIVTRTQDPIVRAA